MNLDHSLRKEPTKMRHVSPSDTAKPQKSTRTRLGQPGPNQVDWAGRPPGRPYGRLGHPGRPPGRPGAWAGIFPPSLVWIRFLKFELRLNRLNFNLNSETSGGHNSFIRSPIHANSDSISSRILRRTQWRNPFPLILSYRINFTLICEA